MKKFVLLSLSAALLSACSSSEEVTPASSNDPAQRVSMRYRSPEKAWEYANTLISGGVGARSGQRLKSASDVAVVTTPMTRSGECDTLFYAVDVENDGGFVLIAAPLGMEPVMGIVESGSFNDPANLENEAYQETLALMSANIQEFAESNVGVSPLGFELELAWYADTIVHKGDQTPQLQVAWGTGWPENTYAPNKDAGCVPVAIAQLMSYLEQPTRIEYQCKDFNVLLESLNWSSIKAHKRSNEGNSGCAQCTATDAAHNQLARLVREIGERTNTDYTTDVTRTYYTRYSSTSGVQCSLSSPITALTGKSPISSGTTFNNLMKGLISNGGVALVSSDNNHLWIADGYKYVEYEIHEYNLNNTLDPSLGKYIETVKYKMESELIHLNWGRGGACNGWFKVTNLASTGIVDSNKGTTYDYNLPKFSYTATNNNTYYFLYKK